MSSQPAAAPHERWTTFEQLSLAREVMQTESRTIAQVARGGSTRASARPSITSSTAGETCS